MSLFNPFPHTISAWVEIQKLKEQFSNDEEFGREVRKYLDTPYQSYSNIQLDYIGEGGIKEVETQDDIIAYRSYFIRDNKLYMTNDSSKILPGENYCYISSTINEIRISKVIKKSKDIANLTAVLSKDEKDFTPEKLKQYLENNYYTTEKLIQNIKKNSHEEDNI
jgi:hypothetical protein